MPAFDAFPAAEAVAAQIIRDALTDSRVYSSIPKSPTYPLFVVQRLGGVPAERHHLDRANIQIDVWGSAPSEPASASKSDIHAMAQAARVALHEAEGRTFRVLSGDKVDAYVTGIEDLVGIAWSPDPGTARDRYIFSVYMYLHS